MSQSLLDQIRACRICEAYLPLGARPVVQGERTAKLLIIGQAPGRKVHETGIPWNDPSGDRLREWLNLDKKIFYDAKQVAIMPMAFCYPGKAKSGDLPPRKECFETWHKHFKSYFTEIQLTLLAGNYAQDNYLDSPKTTATETIRSWREYYPRYLPLPHPSPRNNIWLKKNPWFAETVVPEIRKAIKKLKLTE